MLGAVHGGNEAAASPSPEHIIEPSNDASIDLASCADAIAAPPATSVRGPVHVDDLERTGAACREQLRAAAGELSSSDSALARWADAEDVLANRIALMTEYYTSDPYLPARDGDGRQLWIEYSEALTVRDAALAQWRRDR